MKLILAKTFWTFDLELTDKSVKDWTDQKIFLLHEKTPMFVRLRPRE